MSGLLRRLRRRPATADESRSPAIDSSEPVATPTETSGDQPLPASPETQAAPADTQATQVLPATTDQAAVAPDQPTAFAAQPAPARDLPAGVDPADLAAAPAPSARRGKLRRRLRYLRHVRELLLRDLGGFTYEIHRSAGGKAQEAHRVLAAAKAKRLSTLDAEVAALETRLGEPHAGTVLREPGIGGICPRCGELHASDAHFCSRCGEPLDPRARAQRDSAIAAAAQPVAAAEPQQASVLWAGGPRPEKPAAEEQPEKPAAVTSEWLGTAQPTTFEKPEEKAAPAKPARVRKPAKRVATRPAPAADEAQPDEPKTVVDEPAADDPPKADEPTTVVDEPKPDAPKAGASDETPGDEVPKTNEPQRDEPGPGADAAVNGRHDDRVPRPVTSGDPLAAPRDQK